MVPHSGVFLDEWVAEWEKRLSWLTGFTGSAGLCIATSERAALFVDGRYTIQASKQVDTDHFEIVELYKIKPAEWLAEVIGRESVVGYDDRIHSHSSVKKLRLELQRLNIELRRTENCIDKIWLDRPKPAYREISPYPEKFAGESRKSKIQKVAARLKQASADFTVITKPDCIAWLLNIRGSDFERCPIMHAFAIAGIEGIVELFIGRPELKTDFPSEFGDEVVVRPLAEFGRALAELRGTILVREEGASDWVFGKLVDADAKLAKGDDPCGSLKAVKNDVEIAGSKKAHSRDGAAVVEFLAWISSHADSGQITEIDVVSKLEEFRRSTRKLRDLSFDTIAATGPNAAIVHYRVTYGTNRDLCPGDLLLVDSGGQYRDGTTDITRTIAIGEPGLEQRQCFTRVLKGLIALSRMRWPADVTGRELNVIARYPLWLEGQDYDHGTGHGVGHYLGVHEGPQGISRRSETPLSPGLIVSIEPGYYRKGQFGIRLENLAVVEQVEPDECIDGLEMLRFRTLTLAPFDRNLILADELDNHERAWVDSYHAKVLNGTAGRCTSTTREWLKEACAAL